MQLELELNEEGGGHKRTFRPNLFIRIYTLFDLMGSLSAFVRQNGKKGAKNSVVVRVYE